MAAHIDELEMRRKFRVRGRPGRCNIAGVCVFEAGSHAVAEQHVYGWLRKRIMRSLAQIERTERVVLREIVLEGFDKAGR